MPATCNKTCVCVCVVGGGQHACDTPVSTSRTIVSHVYICRWPQTKDWHPHKQVVAIPLVPRNSALLVKTHLFRHLRQQGSTAAGSRSST